MIAHCVSAANRAARTFRTVRHLRAIQLWNRVVRRWPLPVHHDIHGARLCRRPERWCVPIAGQPSLVASDVFRFHGLERRIANEADWSASDMAPLWRYHLHYFDDLTAEHAEVRSEWHRGIIDRWIDENPEGRSPAWDAYPTSLRIVNWLKWWLAGGSLSDEAARSLVLQAGRLERRVEWHLLGNHLFENGKALWFAGALHYGTAAKRWLEVGQRIVLEELQEQILPDGGHFERSPMYHSRMLENVLDIINLERSLQREPPADMEAAAVRMIDWLATLTHPSGSFALFNDCAIDQSPDLAALRDYAARLEISSAPTVPASRLLPDTGYGRVEYGPWVLLFDVAPLGPDYLPAHGHADTLTFELSLYGLLLAVDGGTSTYEMGDVRCFERSTAAHNTLVLDGADSSEVWSSFRVGRRARVLMSSLQETDDGWMAAGSHDGFAVGVRPAVHVRKWKVDTETITIIDQLASKRQVSREVVWRMHIHPSTEITRLGERTIRLSRQAVPVAHFEGDSKLEWALVDAAYAPRFGTRLRTQCIEGRGIVQIPVTISCSLTAVRS